MHTILFEDLSKQIRVGTQRFAPTNVVFDVMWNESSKANEQT